MSSMNSLYDIGHTIYFNVYSKVSILKATVTKVYFNTTVGVQYRITFDSTASSNLGGKLYLDYVNESEVFGTFTAAKLDMLDWLEAKTNEVELLTES